MPHVDNPQLISASEPESLASPTLVERINFVVGFLRRRYLIILISFLLSVAGVYLYATPPTYTASATMMIETRKSPLEALVGNAPLEPAWIESQIGVLKSQSVAFYVVKQLRLAGDRKFLRPEGRCLTNSLPVSDGGPRSQSQKRTVWARRLLPWWADLTSGVSVKAT